jgi:aminoglycoside 6'-N-acetyltransferase
MEMARPLLVGTLVSVRPGSRPDVGALVAILAEPSVSEWWGEPDSAEAVESKLRGAGGEALLVLEVEGQVAGGIEYHEEYEPMYRHAGIDIFVAARHQNRGVGTEAVSLLARWLITARDHHRLTIDPAVANTRAVRSYEKVGFRPVGVMRRYERGLDGRFHDGLLMDLLAEDLDLGTGV